MSHNDNDAPRRMSSYARNTTDELLRKVESHKRMLVSIEREIKRREDAGYEIGRLQWLSERAAKRAEATEDKQADNV